MAQESTPSLNPDMTPEKLWCQDSAPELTEATSLKRMTSEELCAGGNVPYWLVTG